jgi:hypothetical protein
MITGKTYGYARVSSSGQDYGIREAARSGTGLARRLSAVGTGWPRRWRACCRPAADWFYDRQRAHR